MWSFPRQYQGAPLTSPVSSKRLAGKFAVGKRLDYLGTVEQLHQ
jgi:hypothetical protein